MNSYPPDAGDAFAPDLEAPAWFSVAVEDHGNLPARSDRKIVFHGVNKSGSLCLSNVISDALAHEGRKAQFHSHYQLRGITFPGFIKRIETTPAPGFFVGHQLFGNLPLDDPNLVLITQFRHPLPRLLSCYEWVRKKHVRKGGTTEAFPDFEQFIKKGRGKSHSQIVQFATRYPEDRLQLMSSLTPRELFERSVEHIERHVYFTGIAELFEETIFAVAHICGIQNVPAWKKDERNAGRPMAWTLPQSGVDLVRDIYRYDFELYEWAKQRFEKLLRQITVGGDFEAYQAKCKGQYQDRLLSTGDQDSRTKDQLNRNEYEPVALE
jgi:hypothetical protein